MLIVVLLGFLVAAGIISLNTQLKIKVAKSIFLFPLGLFIYFLTYFSEVLDGKKLLFKTQWVKSLGVHLDFNLDGLSLLFSLMITGIGTLVFVYAARYLRNQPYIGRFFCYLTFFMASMLGLVLSDNLLALFIFWELTSISSFFLIGFQNENEQARKNSLLALSITGGGGFFLMAGCIVLGSYMDTYSIQEIINNPIQFQEAPIYTAILILILAGAFTKSAQFPFHFWLPGAMKAPTPVSAYLHSATMVKAGIYLLARLFPLLSGTDIWFYTLLIVGSVTMLYAAIQSLFRTDLKGILAYSTIASLGIMVMLLGIGTYESMMALYTFIIAHALYKATLFLVTGIIDFKTKSRDIQVLHGLRKIMPIVAVAGGLAAISNAGIPLTFGFISKEIVYTATYELDPWLNWWITGATILSNIFLIYAAYNVGISPFRGEIPGKFANLQRPHKSFWIPPMILAVLGVIFGVFPGMLDQLVGRILSYTGFTEKVHLSIWHGFNTVLFLSIGTLIGGILISLVYKASHKSDAMVEKLETYSPKAFITGIADFIRRIAYIFTRLMHNGYLRIYLMVIISFFTILVGYKLFRDVPLQVNTSQLSEFRIYEITVIAVMVGAILLIVSTSSRLTAIVALSVLGFCICLIFIFYGAPDLAMTQFTIDTLTVVLFMLVMYKLPNFLQFKNTKIQFRDALISICFGVLISIITLQALVTPSEKKASQFYANNAYLLGKGKNIVNVILVDFRGLDTMVEIIVLSIAAIGVYSMLKLKVDQSIKE